jgi:hypothetical protein
VRPDLGDAGTLLDATAKAAYRARLVELRAELAEAEGFNDPARAAKARQELEFVVGELARAVGLGGRDRRAASHAERARLNATSAIRAAMANLARDNPALGGIWRPRSGPAGTAPTSPARVPRSPGNADLGYRPRPNTGAPGLNAHLAAEGSARRRSRGARSSVPGKWPATHIRINELTGAPPGPHLRPGQRRRRGG